MKVGGEAVLSLGISETPVFKRSVNIKDPRKNSWTGFKFFAHAFLKMDIKLDPIKLLFRFFTKYRTKRRKSMPGNFLALIGEIDAAIKFTGDLDNSLDCVFGARSCSTDDLTSLIFDNEVYLSGAGSFEINLNKIIGVLPKIVIDLDNAAVYKRKKGLYFHWQMTNILDYLGDFLDQTIGKIADMPSLAAEPVEFDAFFDEDGFGFHGKYRALYLNCEVYFHETDPIRCSFNSKYFSVMMESLEDVGNSAKAIYVETKKFGEK